MGRESEWSHYSAVTSHSFSLLSNQVSSNHKGDTTATALCHPPVVTRCSRFRIRKNDTFAAVMTILLRRCEIFFSGAVSGVALAQWKQAGRGSGRCELGVSESTVWKEVRLSSPERIWQSDSS